MAFDVIVLSTQKKFLSRKACLTVHETALFVQNILQKDLVGSLSIKRVVPKPMHEGNGETVSGHAGTTSA